MTPLSSTCRGEQRENNVRTGRAGVSKITNVALTLVVSGSRERSKLYGASRRMARARRGRDGPIVARSSAAYRYRCAHTSGSSVVASTLNRNLHQHIADIDGWSTITARDTFADDDDDERCPRRVLSTSRSRDLCPRLTRTWSFEHSRTFLWFIPTAVFLTFSCSVLVIRRAILLDNWNQTDQLRFLQARISFIKIYRICLYILTTNIYSLNTPASSIFQENLRIYNSSV